MKKRLSFDAIAVILMVLFDQLTKRLAASCLKGNQPVTLIKGVLELHYTENTGAAFSILEGKQIFFYIITVVVAVLIIIWLIHMPKGKKYRPLNICACVMLAGALGNFIDRVLRRYVVDFIYFSLINFPIFNVADIYVTCSCVMILILMFTLYKEDDMNVLFLGKEKADEETIH